MSKLATYHLITAIPIFLFTGLYIYHVINSVSFLLIMIVYAFIFRPIIDYKKLKGKGLVTKNQFIRSLGFIRFKYYSELMFED